ncbi:MAG: hypothetical protein QNJ47_03450 [Nostocaceae cyanobacterium]|nr:hypothetical protein [Nostocaceae cyanobacterium]
MVLEPTGVHYSWIWAHICQAEGIKVVWVGHAEAVHYRKQNQLPDKTFPVVFVDFGCDRTKTRSY